MELVGHHQIGWPIQNYKGFHRGNIMRRDGDRGCVRALRRAWLIAASALVIGSLTSADRTTAQEAKPTGGPQQVKLPVHKSPAAPVGSQPLPINLPTAFQLANAQAIDVAIASQRIEVAMAQL